MLSSSRTCFSENRLSNNCNKYFKTYGTQGTIPDAEDTKIKHESRSQASYSLADKTNIYTANWNSSNIAYIILTQHTDPGNS